MDEEKKHTPPSPKRQIKAKKACEHRAREREDNQKEERMGG